MGRGERMRSEGPGTERAGSAKRRAPLVSAAAVRRWASSVGLEVGDDGPDRRVVELYVDRLRAAGDGAVDDDGPVPCPRCGRVGHIDHLDLAAGEQVRRCTPCGVGWTAPLTAGP